MMRAIALTQKATSHISVGAASQRVLIANVVADGQMQVRVRNAGSADVWFAFGDSTVAAAISSTDPSIGTGGVEVFTVNVPLGGAVYAAAIAAGATGNIEFTPGAGI